jgi:hypothetical protein
MMMMEIRLRNPPIILAILAILFSSVLANISVAFLVDASVKVDVFTQKQPYSGRGLNMPSDAFGPQENVVLYALVTHNDVPVDNMLVAFTVKTPNGTYFSLSARTNTSGIATVNFRIPTPSINVSENDVFGYWFVLAEVSVAGNIYQDTLTFRVDWIVKLLSVETIQYNQAYRIKFGRNGDMGLKITLRSIAMTLRNATIAVVIKDELNVPVNFSNIQDFAVQPAEKLVFLYCKATIPKWAFVGKAKVLVSALESINGTPYCPAISTNFTITGTGPLKIDYHDPGIVAILPSAKSIQVGQGLSLKTLVRNKGTVVQNFSVSTYFDNTLLGTFNVTALLLYSTVAFNFTLNASQLTLGNHTISAYIPPVPNEADLTDNHFADVIEVRPKPPAIIHDIAVTSIKVSNNSVFIGQTVQINVTVINNGTEVETFEVSTYYNSSLIETSSVIDLEPASQVMLTFTWNTLFVHEGSYQISAFAPLPSDATPSDNTLVDSVVQVKTKPPSPPFPPFPPFPLPSVLLWSVALTFIVAVVASLALLLLLYYPRRRRKKPSRRVYTVVVHPRI